MLRQEKSRNTNLQRPVFNSKSASTFNAIPQTVVVIDNISDCAGSVAIVYRFKFDVRLRSRMRRLVIIAEMRFFS